MKLLLAIGIIAVELMVGCGYNGQDNVAKEVRPYWMYADTIHGHVYITTVGGRGEPSTVHAEHCHNKKHKEHP